MAPVAPVAPAGPANRAKPSMPFIPGVPGVPGILNSLFSGRPWADQSGRTGRSGRQLAGFEIGREQRTVLTLALVTAFFFSCLVPTLFFGILIAACEAPPSCNEQRNDRDRFGEVRPTKLRLESLQALPQFPMCRPYPQSPEIARAFDRIMARA